MFYSISFYANRPTFDTDYEGIVELFGDAGANACDQIDAGQRVAFIGEVEIREADPDEQDNVR